jgi:MFS family permease
MQGRVFSLYSSVVTGAMLLGLITAGPVADSLDIRSIYWIAAGAWLLIIPLAAFSKSLMDLENHPAEEKAEEES